MHEMIDAKHANAKRVYVDAPSLQNILYDAVKFVGLAAYFAAHLQEHHETVIAHTERR